jgi:parallel beta-helix repeat protein
MAREKLGVVLIITLLIAGWLFIARRPARASGFEVDSHFDDSSAGDVNPGDCICADLFGACTLRAAIQEANACSGIDTITFSTAMTITLDTTVGVLPSLDEQVTIDASGVWDTMNDKPGVTLDGDGGSFSGLYLGAGMCEVYGLSITNFDGTGIYVVSSANRIGGSGFGQRNVLSGNDTGLFLVSSSTKLNVVYNNYLGLTADGSAGHPNATGIYIGSGASSNTIGGSGINQTNFIAGNTSDGIMIDGSGTDNNSIIGNAIGLASDMLTDVGNGGHGIRVQNGPANSVIGDSTSGNIIGYNVYSGVYLYNVGSGTDVSHNIIGSNASDGVHIHDTSGCILSDNLISSNTYAGVRISGASASGNIIWSNSIYSNGGKGILLMDGSNMDIAAPVIVNASNSGASGTACGSCRVALYSDASDEGQIYHDILWADASGNWSYSGTLTGPNLTATALDGLGNTSEFSAPHLILEKVFLPLVMQMGAGR